MTIDEALKNNKIDKETAKELRKYITDIIKSQDDGACVYSKEYKHELALNKALDKCEDLIKLNQELLEKNCHLEAENKVLRAEYNSLNFTIAKEYPELKSEYKNLGELWHKSVEEKRELEEKLKLAKKTIINAGSYLTCMEELDEEKCNEQLALECLIKGLEELDK